MTKNRKRKARKATAGRRIVAMLLRLSAYQLAFIVTAVYVAGWWVL